MSTPFVLTYRNVALFLLAAGAVGCTGEERIDEPTPPLTPAAHCEVHGPPLGAQFVDRTTAWGLDQPGVEAWVMSATDLNGDGYPDLVAHVPSGSVRSSMAGKKYVSVLMNEPTPDGHRHFVDRTVESGYGATRDGATGELRVATGAVYGDVDNDGDVDILSLTGSQPPASDPATPGELDRSELLLNDGSGHFSLALDAGVRSDDPRPIWGATLADVDRDGALDAFVATWISAQGTVTQQTLLAGDGGGRFSDVSAISGIRDPGNARAATGVTACDIDDDGWPELMVSAYGRAPNMMLRSDGAGGFYDVGEQVGYAYDEGVDYHDDQSFLCYCQTALTDTECNGMPAASVDCSQIPPWIPGRSDRPSALGGNTFATVCSDLTGDGKLDLYNVEIQHWWAGSASDPSALLVNASDDGGFKLERPSRDETGMQWEHYSPSWNEGGIDVAVGDLDNDGREDVIVGRSDYDDQYGMIFHQLADGTFEQVAEAWGITHPCAATPIVADFDRDGDLDVVFASSRMRDWCAARWENNAIRFYENDAGLRSDHLAVRLVANGTSANRSAIGARVIVHAGETTLTKEVSGAYGHGANQQDLVQFFGLGSCEQVSSIEVRWPDAAGTVEVFDSIPTGGLVELRQGDPAVYSIEL